MFSVCCGAKFSALGSSWGSFFLVSLPVGEARRRSSCEPARPSYNSLSIFVAFSATSSSAFCLFRCIAGWFFGCTYVKMPVSCSYLMAQSRARLSQRLSWAWCRCGSVTIGCLCLYCPGRALLESAFCPVPIENTRGAKIFQRSKIASGRCVVKGRRDNLINIFSPRGAYRPWRRGLLFRIQLHTKKQAKKSKLHRNLYNMNQ